jgi:hypothetical protein
VLAEGTTAVSVKLSWVEMEAETLELLVRLRIRVLLAAVASDTR